MGAVPTIFSRWLVAWFAQLFWFCARRRAALNGTVVTDSDFDGFQSKLHNPHAISPLDVEAQQRAELVTLQP